MQIHDSNILSKLLRAFVYPSTGVFRLMLGLFFCLIVSNVYSQEEFEYVDSSLLQKQRQPGSSDAEEGEAEHTLYLYPMLIPTDSIVSWRADTRFGYMRTLDSLLHNQNEEHAAARALRARHNYEDPGNLNDRRPDPSAAQSFLSSGIVQSIFWILAICMVLFILYKLIFNRGQFRQSSNKAAVNILDADPEQVQAPSDYDGLIQQAFKLSDFRMAIRYLFLKALSQLSGKGHIQLSPDKTNMQYLRELNGERQQDFAKLLMRYEYIWYGHQEISREIFEENEKLFTSFSNKI